MDTLFTVLTAFPNSKLTDPSFHDQIYRSWDFGLPLVEVTTSIDHHSRAGEASRILNVAPFWNTGTQFHWTGMNLHCTRKPCRDPWVEIHPAQHCRSEYIWASEPHTCLSVDGSMQADASLVDSELYRPCFPRQVWLLDRCTPCSYLRSPTLDCSSRQECQVILDYSQTCTQNPFCFWEDLGDW